jgi:CRP/FNR family cyclic AMP-dependent transcriptional regulator
VYLDTIKPQRLCLLTADPELGELIPDEELLEARRRSVVAVIDAEGPDWNPAPVVSGAAPTWPGLIVVEGLLLRRVTVANRMACAVLGSGDVFRPWDDDNVYSPLQPTTSWLVLKPARIAVLDENFARRLARWPSVQTRLLARLHDHVRQQVAMQAVRYMRRTHTRLLLLFWLLAARWGRVARDGVVIELPVTHKLLAMLVGCRRPTVTLALQTLGRNGLLTREGNDRWRLSHKALDLLDEPQRLYALDREAGSHPRAAVRQRELLAVAHGD